jgi:hypothetical protein
MHSTTNLNHMTVRHGDREKRLVAAIKILAVELESYTILQGEKEGKLNKVSQLFIRFYKATGERLELRIFFFFFLTNLPDARFFSPHLCMYVRSSSSYSTDKPIDIQSRLHETVSAILFINQHSIKGRIKGKG